MLSRRHFTAGASGLAASATLGRRAAAQDQAPIKIGVVTDMNSAYADQTGAGAVGGCPLVRG